MSAAGRDGVRKADKANTNEKQIPPESHLRRTRAKYPSFTSEKTFLASFHAVVSQHAGGGCSNTLMHPKILLSTLWSASHKSNHGWKVNIFFKKRASSSFVISASACAEVTDVSILSSRQTRLMEACAMETELQRSCSETQSRWHREPSETQWEEVRTAGETGGSQLKVWTPGQERGQTSSSCAHSWIRLSTSISLPLSLKIVFSVSSRHVKHCSALEDRVKLTWYISACCLLTDRTWSSFYALHIWQEGTGWRRTVHVCARWYTCTNTLTFLPKWTGRKIIPRLQLFTACD